MKKLSERLIINDADDYFTFDGIHFDATCFESLLQPFPKGKWIRVESVNEYVTFRTKTKL